MDDLSDIQYASIHDYDFAHWFESVDYNGKTLSKEERCEYVSFMNEMIDLYSSGLSIIKESLDEAKSLNDEYHSMCHTLDSVMLFVYMTLIDSMALGKYFIIADREYDRQLMRGKMQVLLNEGFKQLYGFGKPTKRIPEWKRLSPLMPYFPDEIQKQYSELTDLLEKHSQSSSWWKDERNYETHLDVEKLYNSRMEDVVESKVMMDSLQLTNTLMAVSGFLGNMHACVLNDMLMRYKKGLITE